MKFHTGARPQKKLNNTLLRKLIMALLALVLVFVMVGAVAAPSSTIADEYANWQNELTLEGRSVVILERTMGLNFEKIDGKLFVKYVSPQTPAQQMGIQVGDQVLSINGTRLERMSFNRMRTMLTVPAGYVMKFELLRDNKRQLEATIVSLDNTDSGFAWEVVNDIAYISNSYIDSRTLQMLEAASERILSTRERDHIRGLVYDLRNNSSSDYTHAIETYNQIIEIAAEQPIVLLVNQRTINAAQFIAMILQRYDGISVIGSPTGEVTPNIELQYALNQKIAAFNYLQGTAVSEISMFLDNSLVAIDGHTSSLEDSPYIDSQTDAVMLPFFFMLEAAGGSIAWNSNSLLFELSYGDASYSLDSAGRWYNSERELITRLSIRQGVFYADIDLFCSELGFDYILERNADGQVKSIITSLLHNDKI